MRLFDMDKFEQTNKENAVNAHMNRRVISH